MPQGRLGHVSHANYVSVIQILTNKPLKLDSDYTSRSVFDTIDGQYQRLSIQEVQAIFYIYRLFQVQLLPRPHPTHGTLPLWNFLPARVAEAPSEMSCSEESFDIQYDLHGLRKRNLKNMYYVI